VISDSVHRFIIAYDIVSDQRRTRIAHTLESYGDRIQYSVFLVDAKPAKIVRIRATVLRHMDLSEDRALICDLGPLAGIQRMLEFIGSPPVVTTGGPLVI
jgi:CRISPR-associated protein Cas2